MLFDLLLMLHKSKTRGVQVNLLGKFSLIMETTHAAQTPQRHSCAGDVAQHRHAHCAVPAVFALAHLN